MKKILLVVDMQNDFIDGSLGTSEAVAIVPKVQKKIEEAIKGNSTVYVTKDTHQENYLSTQEGKKLPVRHCIEETEGWNLHPAIEQALVEAQQVNMIHKGTFGSTVLAQRIKDMIEQDEEIEVEIVGLCTDICVVSNALVMKAFVPEVTITVDASCCAGVTPESHQAALQTMKMCQINIINE